MKFLFGNLLLFAIFCSFLFPQKEYVFDIDKIRLKNLFNQGMNYYQNKSYEAAISKFLQSLKIEPRNNRIRYFLGEAFYKAGYIENAITQWDNIIKLGGQDSYLSQKINQIYYLIGQKKRNFFFYRLCLSKNIANTKFSK